MNLLLLHATGLAWDEISFLVVPVTAVMGLVLFLTRRDTEPEADEDATEAAELPHSLVGGDVAREG